MHWALLDSWGKHVDQLKLRRKWHPAKSSLGQDPTLNFANLSIFFNHKFDSVHLLHASLTFSEHWNEDCRPQLKTWPRTWTPVATWQPWCQALHEEWVGAKAGTQDKEYKCCCNHQQYRKRLCRVVIDAFIWPLQLLQSSCISTEEKYFLGWKLHYILFLSDPRPINVSLVSNLFTNWDMVFRRHLVQTGKFHNFILFYWK